MNIDGPFTVYRYIHPSTIKDKLLKEMKLSAPTGYKERHMAAQLMLAVASVDTS